MNGLFSQTERKKDAENIFVIQTIFQLFNISIITII